MKAKRSLVPLWLLCWVLLPATANEAQTVTQIAAGGDNSLFLKSDGSLWGMGYNDYGQLGDGTYNQTNCPEQIVASNVTAIAAGAIHSLFLKSDGSLWGMGYNGNGELGNGTYNSMTNRPQQIVASNVKAIAAGDGHSLFLKSNGSLWAMGFNSSGQLGDGTYNNANLPQQIVASNVTAIAAGWGHSLFVKNDGSLWAVGSDEYGQLGDGTSGTYDYTNRPQQIVASNVTAIGAGEFHSLFVKSDGSLWGMGNDYQGELGDGTYMTVTPYCTNQPEQILSSNVVAVAAGQFHSLLLKNDGSLWATGYNGFGQLGDGTTGNTNRPEQIVAGVPAGYNQISCQLLGGGCVCLSFVGMAGTNYALDHSVSLSPANWVPQFTNPAGAGGMVLFTNTPDPTTINFWRIRSVP